MAKNASSLISVRHSNAVERCIDRTKSQPSGSRFAMPLGSFMSGELVPRGPKGEKGFADVIGMSVKVMRIATGEEEEELDRTAKSAAAELGSRGGKAQAAKMSPKRRAEIARKAAMKRWAKS